VRDVDEVLFLYAASLDPGDAKASRRAIEICDRALRFVAAPGPWRALRAWYDEAPEGMAATEPHEETSAVACFEWAVLRDRQRRAGPAIGWMERASRIVADDAWYHYFLATLARRAERPELAMRHLEAAIALDTDSRRFQDDRDRLIEAMNEPRATGDRRQAERVEAPTAP
jgi:eukaryotic-like serine/threonine-protein kinase